MLLFSSALPSAVKLGTVISQRIRYIAICSTEKAFNTVWDPYYLLAKMDVKAARRGFTSWDEDCDAERVVPLVLGARPGTKDYWREFRNLHFDSFEGFPQAALDHLPSKMLNSLTCTDSLSQQIGRGGRGWPGCICYIFLPFFHFPLPFVHSPLSLPRDIQHIYIYIYIYISQCAGALREAVKVRDSDRPICCHWFKTQIAPSAATDHQRRRRNHLRRNL